MTNHPPVPPHGPSNPYQPSDANAYPPHNQYQQPGAPYPAPGSPLSTPPKQRKKWPWIVGAIVAVLVLAAAFGSGGDSDSSKDGAASDSSTSSDSNAVADGDKSDDSREKPKQVGLNTPVRDGKFEFTVTAVDSGLQSVGDNPYLTEEAQGQFVVVSLKVENIGDEPQSFSPSAQKATDAKGRTFEADTTAQIALGGSDVTVWDSINPGNSVDVKLVFDMPKNARPAAVELHDSMFSGGVKVNLK